MSWCVMWEMKIWKINILRAADASTENFHIKYDKAKKNGNQESLHCMRICSFVSMVCEI